MLVDKVRHARVRAALLEAIALADGLATAILRIHIDDDRQAQAAIHIGDDRQARAAIHIGDDRQARAAIHIGDDRQARAEWTDTDEAIEEAIARSLADEGPAGAGVANDIDTAIALSLRDAEPVELVCPLHGAGCPMGPFRTAHAINLHTSIVLDAAAEPG